MPLCEDANLSDVGRACDRTFWSLFLPAVALLILCATAMPKPASVQRVFEPVVAPFRQFLSVEQAEAYEAMDNAPSPADSTLRPPPWRMLVLTGLALAEALAWIFVASLLAVQRTPLLSVARAYVAGTSWLYATVRPTARPALTVPYDLFLLFLVHATAVCLSLGGALYEHSAYGAPLPPTGALVLYVLDATVILTLLVIVMSTPVGVPSARVERSKIGETVSPEEYTTLWGWVTFSWVWPLIRKGVKVTLNEDDVWNLGPTFRSKPVFAQFTRTNHSSLLWRILAANSFDILMDFVGSYAAVVFDYARPYFLRRILDAIDHPSSESRSKAYVFAILMFLSQLAKNQANLQHLWYGRRAATRIRSELMAAIFDKALKRKDVSGVVAAGKTRADGDTEPGKSNGSDAGTKADKSKTKQGEPLNGTKVGADIGKIVNMMSGDASSISNAAAIIYLLCAAPFELILGCIFLYQVLGWSAFAGFVVLAVAWPAGTLIMRRIVQIRKKVMTAKDARISAVNELLSAIKFVKFFAWEDRWVGRVLDAREKEMKWLVSSCITTIFYYSLWAVAPTLVSIVSFTVYIVTGNELTIAKAFTSIALFQMIRQPLNILPNFTVQILQTKVNLDRIAAFLDEDEVDEQVSSLKAPPSGSFRDYSDEVYKGFGIETGTFRWNEACQRNDEGTIDGVVAGKPGLESSTGDSAGQLDRESLTAINAGKRRFELRDISVMFPEGKMTIVTGPTASGKTALLMALLGEMTKVEGRVIMRKDASFVFADGLTHTISYAAQMPWLRHQSIKENILFGFPLDEGRYKKVVEACSLLPDLELFEDGDATEIGARGISLSGGQKARVALARAVYAPSKFVLLDDPLSAVDSHTARFLFDKLFCGELLRDRTVVLVTHHVELVLPGAHYLVRMLDGRIDTQGTVVELHAAGILDDIVRSEDAEVEREEQVTEAEKPSAEEIAVGGKREKKPRTLVQAEERQQGSVKWGVYKTYLKASSYRTWIILAILVILVEVLALAEKVWIKAWGEAYSYQGSAFSVMNFVQPFFDMTVDGIALPQTRTFALWSLPPAEEHPLFYVAVYAGIGLTASTVRITLVVMQFLGALRASRVLFKQLLVSVVRATMRWYDTTPTGRMLNRFSKDMDSVDLSIAAIMQEVNTSMASFLASVLTVTFFFPAFLVPAFVLGVIYYYLAISYLNTGRDLRRMESNSRSPIYSGFEEMLEGIVTVRAFAVEKWLFDNLHIKIDVTTKMWYNYWMLNRWLFFNYEVLGAAAVLITTLFALSGFASAGTAGICITSAMAFTMSIYWTCRSWTELELDLNAVERIVEYLTLPQEPQAIIEDSRPPKNWPSSISSNLIVVDDLVVKYAPDLPAVLHNISFALKGGERVGLLGRTGSGKSTLAMSILRSVDPASGRILVDGIDITTIGLHDLRSRITFIPQDASLFSGTLRENIDPFNEHGDDKCIEVLQRVDIFTESATSRNQTRPSSPEASSSFTPGTAESVTDVDSKTIITLDTKVSTGGLNFSQGQRQLIAMARALLRKSSIVILDEATSSIDFLTDAKIQRVMREQFGGALLLTVAHRLSTIIDYDRLIVLDKGAIAEFDTPWNLIQKEGGIFRSMCMKSGSFVELEEMAKAKAAAI
ncbi:multidrug resistance-associated ABC transporter [Vararia minispora EC-137]|uniref:Multidrug resistance-associated ABC transporter n=1 Tax=Vararia minispora EC-137 TaxID=1314806 RepID=A0ACB8QER5_9AGAM|nr:multidrug resistance-associated ABC transporter [Vararia minispora EC-137]